MAERTVARPTMKKASVCLALLIVWLSIAGVSLDARCVGPAPLAREADRADAIFLGRFTAGEMLQGDEDIIVATFEVDQWWKGSGEHRVFILTPDGGRWNETGLTLVVGARYLVFASTIRKNNNNRLLGTGGCSRTRPVEASFDTIKWLNEFVKPVYGSK